MDRQNDSRGTEAPRQTTACACRAPRGLDLMALADRLDGAREIRIPDPDASPEPARTLMPCCMTSGATA